VGQARSQFFEARRQGSAAHLRAFTIGGWRRAGGPRGARGYVLRRERGLTPRSTRDPPRPSALPGHPRWFIIGQPGKALVRSGRVSSNVRRQNTPLNERHRCGCDGLEDRRRQDEQARRDVRC